MEFFKPLEIIPDVLYNNNGYIPLNAVPEGDDFQIMLKAIGSKVDILGSGKGEAYYYLVSDLLENDLVLKMKDFTHHGDTTCFQHCLNVSYYNYKICRFFSLNARAAARAGLLHDLFLYDWHTYKPDKGERLHGFTHAETALKNAKDNFYISDLESDIIGKHMFPLNITALPKYRETLIITFVDKYCGLLETVIPRMKKVGKKFRRDEEVRHSA